MSEKRNSASRLFNSLNMVLRQPENIPTAHAWIRAFPKSTEGDPHLSYFLAIHRLQLLFSELEAIKLHVKNSGFNSETYSPVFEKIENAISPTVLHIGWASVKVNLSPDVMLALNIFRDLMPADEIEIPKDELESLTQDLLSLQQLLIDSDLPIHLKNLIKRYIDSIWEALENYPITGAQALKTATKNAIGELIVARSEISDASAEPAVKKFGSLVKKVNDIADSVIRVDSILQIGYRISEAVQQLLK